MPPPFKPSPPVPIDPPLLETLPLPGAKAADGIWEHFLGNTIQRNVTEPHLHVVRPAVPNGRAVIILPGGGYQFLSMTHEGLAVANDLAKEGYLALILAYRTNISPAQPEAFLEQTGKLFRALGKVRLPENPKAVADLGTAMRYVAEHAAHLGLTDPHADIIGFSAGARTVIAGMENAPDEFQGRSVALIYPTSEADFKVVPKARFFVAIAADDPLFCAGTFDLIQHLSKGGVVEFHLYETGDHGFGRSRPGTSADGWFDQYLRWLKLGAVDHPA